MTFFVECTLRRLGVTQPVEPTKLVRLGYAAISLLASLCALAAALLWMALPKGGV